MIAAPGLRLGSCIDCEAARELAKSRIDCEALAKELTRWKENAQFEHARWFDEFQRNDKFVKWRQSAEREIQELREEILTARAVGRAPEAVWLPKWQTL